MISFFNNNISKTSDFYLSKKIQIYHYVCLFNIKRKKIKKNFFSLRFECNLMYLLL